MEQQSFFTAGLQAQRYNEAMFLNTRIYIRFKQAYILYGILKWG